MKSVIVEQTNKSTTEYSQIFKRIRCKVFGYRSRPHCRLGRPQLHGIRHSIITRALRFRSRRRSRFSSTEHQQTGRIPLRFGDSSLNVTDNGFRESPVSLIVEQEPVILVLVGVFQVSRNSYGMTGNNNEIFGTTRETIFVLSNE